MAAGALSSLGRNLFFLYLFVLSCPRGHDLLPSHRLGPSDDILGVVCDYHAMRGLLPS